MCGYFLPAPYWEPGAQPRHVPLLGIEPVTLWFIGCCSIHSATQQPGQDSCVCLVTAKAFLNGSPGGPGVISSCLAKKQPISNTEFYRGNKGRWVEEPRFCKISHNCASMTLSLKPKAETRNLHYHHYLSYPCFVLHWL